MLNVTSRLASSAAPLLVLVLLPFALLLVMSPAAAQTQQRLGAPEAGAEVTGPVTIAAFVIPDDAVAVDYVDARLTGPVTQTLRLEPIALTDEGSQQWGAELDPLRPGAELPNGSYALEISTIERDGRVLPFTGHTVELRVPPPRQDLSAAPVAGNPRQVRLAWEGSALPDFLAYRIERRADSDNAPWSTALAIPEQTTVEAIDTVPAVGAYRYRLAVVRRSGATDAPGESAELRSTSSTTGVRATVDNPGTFDPPGDDPIPPPNAGSVSSADEGADPEAAAPGPGAITRPDNLPQPDPAEQPEAGQAGGQGGDVTRPEPDDALLQAPAVQVPANPLPQPQAPPSESPAPAAPADVPAPPLGTDVFEPLLPFAETAGEMVVTETETAFIDGEVIEGGSLNVYTEQTLDQQHEILTATGAGLLVLLVAAHIRRYAAGGRR